MTVVVSAPRPGDRCQLTPGCGYPPGHISEHPCGQPHIPGSPCRFCGKPTPADGGPCPDCWTPIPDDLADAKALLACAGLSLVTPERMRPVTTPADRPDLATWLRQQLDNDERIAREAGSRAMAWPVNGTWHLEGVEHDVVGREEAFCHPHNVEHIARHDPARVLAEVDAKRRIMAIHNRRADVFPNDVGGTFDNCCDGCGYEGICDDPVTEDINGCPILRALALPYADRPGYLEEWRP